MRCKNLVCLVLFCSLLVREMPVTLSRCVCTGGIARTPHKDSLLVFPPFMPGPTCRFTFWTSLSPFALYVVLFAPLICPPPRVCVGAPQGPRNWSRVGVCPRSPTHRRDWEGATKSHRVSSMNARARKYVDNSAMGIIALALCGTFVSAIYNHTSSM